MQATIGQVPYEFIAPVSMDELVRKGLTNSSFQFAMSFIRKFNDNIKPHELESARMYMIESFTAKLIDAIQSNISHCGKYVEAYWEYDVAKDTHFIEVNCNCCSWSERIEEVNESIKQ